MIRLLQLKQYNDNDNDLDINVVLAVTFFQNGTETPLGGQVVGCHVNRYILTRRSKWKSQHWESTCEMKQDFWFDRVPVVEIDMIVCQHLK